MMKSASESWFSVEPSNTKKLRRVKYVIPRSSLKIVRIFIKRFQFCFKKRGKFDFFLLNRKAAPVFCRGLEIKVCLLQLVRGRGKRRSLAHLE